MSGKEFNTYLKEARTYYKEVRSSKDRAVKFMQDTGILNKKGELSKDYK